MIKIGKHRIFIQTTHFLSQILNLLHRWYGCTKPCQYSNVTPVYSSTHSINTERGSASRVNNFCPHRSQWRDKNQPLHECLHNGRWRVCVTKIIISEWPLALPLPLIAWYLSQHQQNEMWIRDRDTFLIGNIIGRIIKVPLHYSGA